MSNSQNPRLGGKHGKDDRVFSQFSVTVKQNAFCAIYAICGWTSQRLEGAFALGFTYSSAVLIQDVSDDRSHITRYAIRFLNNSIALEWLLNALLQLEDGWRVEGETLYSPDGSQLEKSIDDLIISAVQGAWDCGEN